VVFLTNNPLRSAADYAAKLTRWHRDRARDVVTAVRRARRLPRRAPRRRTLMLIAEEAVAARLADEGSRSHRKPHEADVVVVSFDRTFDYAKLHAAFRAVRERGAAIVATNPDPYCPTPTAACRTARRCSPPSRPARGRRRRRSRQAQPAQWHDAAGALGLDAAQVAVVGDRLATDVAMGQAIGATGILVLSGATTEADRRRVADLPDLVLASIGELASVPTQEPDRDRVHLPC